MSDSTKDKYNFALYVPVIKEKNWELNENGKVVLSLSVKDPVRRFAGWLVKKSPKTELELDELSSKAWCLIDGERNIHEISKIMSEGAKDPADELRRLVTFVKYCSKRGWISYKNVKSQ